uniref:F5/8 type C domain-containing protein n=1 Tax=Capitella teleta TaxID=283909 RepID=X2A7W5_CAPTE
MDQVSGRGVDGLIPELPVDPLNINAHCAHPNNPTGQAAWFYVDLGSVHQVFNVTLYNTADRVGSLRMLRFSIRVGNTSKLSEHTECSYHQGRVAQRGHVTLDCKTVGRYVSFRRTAGDQLRYVTICEFVVIGYPLSGEGDAAKSLVTMATFFGKSPHRNPRGVMSFAAPLAANI